jgi:hypothetical protein
MELFENDQALRKLADNIKKGECILFLGAGVHAAPPENSSFTYPAEHQPFLGRELVQKMAVECRFIERFPKESPIDLQRVSLCFETTPGLGRKALVDFLDTHLRVGKKPSPTVEMLAKLPFKIVVTTNYDRLLESALNKVGKDPAVYVYNPAPNTPTPDIDEDPSTERPMIYKMHGDLGHRESIVITDEDYITFVQRMSDKQPFHPIPETIRFRLLKWPTLFVGYSLRDYNLRLLFRTLRWRIDPASVPPCFSVDTSPDPLILQVWQHERRFVTFVAQDLWEFIPWLTDKVLAQQ